MLLDTFKLRISWIRIGADPTKFSEKDSTKYTCNTIGHTAPGRIWYHELNRDGPWAKKGWPRSRPWRTRTGKPPQEQAWQQRCKSSPSAPITSYSCRSNTLMLPPFLLLAQRLMGGPLLPAMLGCHGNLSILVWTHELPFLRNPTSSS